MMSCVLPIRVCQKNATFFNFAITWHVGRMVHLGKKTDELKVFQNPTMFDAPKVTSQFLQWAASPKTS